VRVLGCHIKLDRAIVPWAWSGQDLNLWGFSGSCHSNLGLRLCTCVSEEGGGEKSAGSEAPSLLSEGGEK
jgi:hypothetical protein